MTDVSEHIAIHKKFKVSAVGSLLDLNRPNEYRFHTRKQVIRASISKLFASAVEAGLCFEPHIVHICAIKFVVMEVDAQFVFRDSVSMALFEIMHGCDLNTFIKNNIRYI